MIGRPGSGKGTQAKLLADKINSPIYSSGNEFRAWAAGPTFVGRRLKGAMEAGELMPSWLSSYLFEKVLFTLEPEQKIVFEGACRTEPEAMLFHEVAQWLPRAYKAVYLRISEEEAWKRLLVRQQQSGRADDDTAVIRHRFEEYKKKNEAVIDIFRGYGTLVEVNGEQPIEDTHKAVMQALTLA